MGYDTERRCLERLRTVHWLLNCSGSHPGGVDGTRQCVLTCGTPMNLVDYAQRLNDAYANGDEAAIKQLLLAKL